MWLEITTTALLVSISQALHLMKAWTMAPNSWSWTCHDSSPFHFFDRNDTGCNLPWSSVCERTVGKAYFKLSTCNTRGLEKSKWISIRASQKAFFNYSNVALDLGCCNPDTALTFSFVKWVRGEAIFISIKVYITQKKKNNSFRILGKFQSRMVLSLLSSILMPFDKIVKPRKETLSA